MHQTKNKTTNLYAALDKAIQQIPPTGCEIKSITVRQTKSKPTLESKPTSDSNLNLNPNLNLYSTRKVYQVKVRLSQVIEVTHEV